MIFFYWRDNVLTKKNKMYKTFNYITQLWWRWLMCVCTFIWYLQLIFTYIVFFIQSYVYTLNHTIYKITERYYLTVTIILVSFFVCCTCTSLWSNSAYFRTYTYFVKIFPSYEDLNLQIFIMKKGNITHAHTLFNEKKVKIK